MLKGNIGCGILAMGDAYKNGGLILSLVLTVLISVTSVYNQHLLVSGGRCSGSYRVQQTNNIGGRIVTWFKKQTKNSYH